MNRYDYSDAQVMCERSDREARSVDAPSMPPGWLTDELRANPVFVQEAIENGGDATFIALTNAWLGRGTYGDAVETAVAAWIAHWWQFGDFDAHHISRVWSEFAEEAKAAA